MNSKIQTFLEKRLGFEFRAAPNRSLMSPQAVDTIFDQVTGMIDNDQVLLAMYKTRTELRKMTADDDIEAALNTRRNALNGVPWRFEGSSVDNKFISDQYSPWDETVRNAVIEARCYGYAVLEATYLQTPDGQIGIKEIAERNFEWFIPALDGTVKFMSMENPQGEPTDARKFFLITNRQTARQLQGEAIFSRLYWPWFFRKNGWKFWVKWLERHGQPFMLGKTSGDTAVMLKALQGAVQDAYIAVGQGDDVSAIDSSGKGGANFEQFENAILKRYWRSILGQNLSSDVTGGSYAAAQVHDKVREDIKISDVRIATKVGQRIGSVLWQLNEFAGEPPLFVMQDNTGLELDRATRDAQLLGSGAFQLTPAYFSRMYDYELTDMVMPAQTTPAGASPTTPVIGRTSGPVPPPNVKAESGPGYVFGSRFTAAQQLIESQLARVIPGVQPPIAEQDIRDAIKAASDPDDLANRLAVLLSGRSMDEFQETLGRALFAADVMGYASAKA